MSKPRKMKSVRDCPPRGEQKELAPGEFLKYDGLGPGFFIGTEKLIIDGEKGTFLKILFADGDKLFVPVARMHLVKKVNYKGHKRPSLGNLRRMGKRRKAARFIKNFRRQGGSDGNE